MSRRRAQEDSGVGDCYFAQGSRHTVASGAASLCQPGRGPPPQVLAVQRQPSHPQGGSGNPKIRPERIPIRMGGPEASS